MVKSNYGCTKNTMHDIDKYLLAEDIAEAILVKLSTVKSVGDSLEQLSVEEYDKLEDEMIKIILDNLKV